MTSPIRIKESCYTHFLGNVLDKRLKDIEKMLGASSQGTVSHMVPVVRGLWGFRFVLGVLGLVVGFGGSYLISQKNNESSRTVSKRLKIQGNSSGPEVGISLPKEVKQTKRPKIKKKKGVALKRVVTPRKKSKSKRRVAVIKKSPRQKVAVTKSRPVKSVKVKTPIKTAVRAPAKPISFLKVGYDRIAFQRCRPECALPMRTSTGRIILSRFSKTKYYSLLSQDLELLSVRGVFESDGSFRIINMNGRARVVEVETEPEVEPTTFRNRLKSRTTKAKVKKKKKKKRTVLKEVENSEEVESEEEEENISSFQNRLIRTMGD